MGIVDKNLCLCDQQTLVFAAGAVYSERSVYITAAQSIPQLVGGTGDSTGGPHDLGLGTPVNILVRITEACTSAGSTGTLKAQLVMAADEVLTGTQVILESTEAIIVTTLVKGYEMRISGTLPPGVTSAYVGLKLTTAVQDFTAGKVTAYIAPADGALGGFAG